MKIDVVRAWKDPIYRASLSEAERASLPPNPAGLIELSKAELGLVQGGGSWGQASGPSIVLSNGGSGGSQCTETGCPPGLPQPSIYINPGPKVGK